MIRNGFSRPFHPYQITTWVLYPMNCVGFYLLFVPILEVPVLFVATVCYSLSCSVVVVSAFLATYRDPTDPVVVLERVWNQQGVEFDSALYDKIWTLWNTHVSEKSKHWGKCDRWTLHFDHHWKWLNNCIGEVNYNLFIILIIGLELLVWIQITIGVWILY